MNTYLETGIAVVLIIFVFSIVVYVIQELIAANLEFRGKMLKASLNQILDRTNADEKLATAFFDHPQIKMLKKNLDKLPAYIPAANFAMSVMDIIAEKAGNRTGNVLNDFKSGLQQFVNADGDLPVLLRTWADNSTGVKELKETIEKWYNEYMDRVTGWYKKEYRYVTRIIAVCIALGFNLNIINITKTVYGDSQLRTTLVTAAEKMTDQPESVKSYYTATIKSRLDEVDTTFERKIRNQSNNNHPIDSLNKRRNFEKDSIISNYNQSQIRLAKSLIDSVSRGKLVFGWSNSPVKTIDANTGLQRNATWWEITLMLIGILIGATAISMGAPFWFDVMVKLVNVRRAGLKPQKGNK